MYACALLRLSRKIFACLAEGLAGKKLFTLQRLFESVGYYLRFIIWFFAVSLLWACLQGGKEIFGQVQKKKTFFLLCKEKAMVDLLDKCVSSRSIAFFPTLSVFSMFLKEHCFKLFYGKPGVLILPHPAHQKGLQNFASAATRNMTP